MDRKVAHALFALVLGFFWTVPVQAQVVRLESPQHPTLPWSQMPLEGSVFHWDEVKGLHALATFSNRAYLLDVTTPLEEVTYQLNFPGVLRDAKNGTYYVRMARGRVVVAREQGGRILTSPNARLRILVTRGTVSAVLEANPSGGPNARG
jgi:hypothetical protein